MMKHNENIQIKCFVIAGMMGSLRRPMEKCQQMDKIILTDYSDAFATKTSQSLYSDNLHQRKSEWITNPELRNSFKRLFQALYLDDMAEQVRENIGSLTESLLSDSLDVNGSSLALFSDTPFTDNSINLDDSVFDDRESSRDLNFTDSISENVVNNSDLKSKTDVLKRWYNTGERRFERGIGTNNISNDIISFTPVSKDLISQPVQR